MADIKKVIVYKDGDTPPRRHSGIRLAVDGVPYMSDIAVACPACPEGVLQYQASPFITCDTCHAAYIVNDTEAANG